MTCTNQQLNPCNYCPWLPSSLVKGYYFNPDKLQSTIIEDLNNECVQSCHSERKYFCVGYLSFVEQNIEGGIRSLWLGRIAIDAKILSPTLIASNIEVFKSIDEMLTKHQEMVDWQQTIDRVSGELDD